MPYIIKNSRSLETVILKNKFNKIKGKPKYNKIGYKDIQFMLKLRKTRNNNDLNNNKNINNDEEIDELFRLL